MQEPDTRKTTMKFNGVGSKHYTPLPQSLSDDEHSADTQPADPEDGTVKDGVRQATFPLPYLAGSADDKLADDTKKVLLSPDPTEVDERELPMSPLRKTCFVLSLVTAVLFVVSLGWLIPCRYGSLQPLESIPTIAQEWTFGFSGLVLTSNLQSTFVPEHECDSVVHLGYERPSSTEGNGATWGVLAVNGKKGSTLWDTQLYAAVAHQSCHEDFCLAQGNGSSPLLAALNKSDGTVLWYAHDHSNLTTIESISEAQEAPDCNGDSVLDFVIVLEVRFSGEDTWVDPHGTPALGAVSGADGRLLATPLPLGLCAGLPSCLTLLPHHKDGETTHTDVLYFCHTLTGDGAVLRTTLHEVCGSNRSGTVHSPRVVWSKPRLKGDVMLQVLTDDTSPSSLVVAWGKGHLSRLTGPLYTPAWSVDLMLDSPIRTILVGHFKAFAASQLFVGSDQNVHSTLFQLVSTVSGEVEWRMQYDNATVRVAQMVPGLSKYVDGALLKATTRVPTTRLDLASWGGKLQEPKYSTYLKLFHRSGKLDPKELKVNTQEEQYFLLDFTNRTVDVLSRLVVQQICIGDICRPNIFSNKENVAMQVLHCSPGSYYLAFATTSASRSSDASVPEDTLLKVALLSHQNQHCCDRVVQTTMATSK